MTPLLSITVSQFHELIAPFPMANPTQGRSSSILLASGRQAPQQAVLLWAAPQFVSKCGLHHGKRKPPRCSLACSASGIPSTEPRTLLCFFSLISAPSGKEGVRVRSFAWVDFSIFLKLLSMQIRMDAHIILLCLPMPETYTCGWDC